MYRGKVAHLGKGFGFLKVAGQKDLFFHFRNLIDVNFNDLQIGDELIFEEIEETNRGPQAIDIRLASEE